MKYGHERVEHFRRDLFVNVCILLVSHHSKTLMKNYFCKQFYLHLVTLPIFEIRTFFGRVSTFFYRLLGKLVNGCLDIMDLDVSIERHVAHHYADIFGSY